MWQNSLSCGKKLTTKGSCHGSPQRGRKLSTSIRGDSTWSPEPGNPLDDKGVVHSLELMDGREKTSGHQVTCLMQLRRSEHWWEGGIGATKSS